jgi:hypothetical protein
LGDWGEKSCVGWDGGVEVVVVEEEEEEEKEEAISG